MVHEGRDWTIQISANLETNWIQFAINGTLLENLPKHTATAEESAGAAPSNNIVLKARQEAENGEAKE